MLINIFGLKIKRSIDSILKRNDRHHVFHNLENMNKILILFSYQDWDQIEIIKQDLESKGKSVYLWTVIPSIKNRNEYSLPQHVKAISVKESAKRKEFASIVEEFESLSYDTLIDLTSKDDYTLKYLLAGNKSEFCIGTREQENKVYDFVLLRNNEMNLSDTYEQLKLYLNKIN